MSITRKIFSVLVLSSALSTPIWAQEASLDTVVANVNDTNITIGHMLAVKMQLPEQYRNLPDAQLFPGILEQLIQQTLLADTLTSDPSWMALALENQRRNSLANHVVDETRSNATTEAAVQAAYDAQYTALDRGMEWNASHILVETRDEAVALIEQLHSGADFAELAKTHSTGPSGPRGGSLGWFGAGQMVPPFEAAVALLETGGISEPVETRFGWHVVKLNETRKPSPPPLENVRASIEADLRDAAVAAKIAELTGNAEITRSDGIDPSVLSTLAFD